MTPSPKESTRHSGPKKGSSCALPGNEKRDVIVANTTPNTSVQDAVQSLTAHSAALEHRRLNPIMPYKADIWARELQNAGLLP
jgi:hypothetical protein